MSSLKKRLSWEKIKNNNKIEHFFYPKKKVRKKGGAFQKI